MTRTPAPVPRRILAVRLGSYCRSPLAARVLADLGGSAVEVRSAGLIDKWDEALGLLVARCRRQWDEHRSLAECRQLRERPSTAATDHHIRQRQHIRQLRPMYPVSR